MDFEEFSHIVISVATISFAFAVARANSLEVTPEFASVFATIMVTVGLGFVLHELAHKYVAERYGAFAQYRAWTLGLVAAVFMAVAFGFVFAAPGAVYIYGGRLSKEKNGKIALAGPLTNYALALIFLLFAFAVPSHASIGFLGAGVNVFLAGFNLLPIHPLDGGKVFDWNKLAWAASIAPAIVFIAFGA